MIVAIEMNTLRVTHVHPSRLVLDALAVLEAGPAPFDLLFENTMNRSFLHNLTTLELSGLYHNLTNKELDPGAGDLVRRLAIAYVADQLVPRDVVQEEVLLQLEYAQENPGPTYRYVKGASTPAIPDSGLWPVTGQGLTLAAMQEAEKQAPQRLSVRDAPRTPAPAKKAPSRPAVTPTGGSRPVIWAHADKVWEESGKPMDKGVVLDLRKRMMAELEEQGIKRTTSSTALGDWMKSRVQ